MFERVDLSEMIVTGTKVRRDMEVRFLKGSRRGEMRYGVFVRGDTECWGTASTLKEAKMLAREGAWFLIKWGVTMVQISIRDRAGRFYKDITLPRGADPKKSKG